MKALVKLAIGSALLLAVVSLARADSIVFASFGTGQSADGAANSAMGYLGYNATTPITTGLGSGTTYNLTNISPWSGPIAGSSWVSDDPGSTVAIGSTPPDGYYTYTSTFSATPGVYTGNLDVYADDTAEVFLNGVKIVSFDTNTVNGPCAQNHNGPTCEGNPFATLFYTSLGAQNTLLIVDWQSGGSAAGVDFEGDLTPGVPEPGSLLLLGSGLMGLAGLLFWKSRQPAGITRTHSRLFPWFRPS